ncbi:MAG: outer membrane beta-barrel protein [candidate division Zixibacteria bacterium]|nr:outer membrane beta-barrel protein [candidate division Zixibacteria bacterium]
MKKGILTVCALLIVAGATTTQAQDAMKKTNFYVGVGATLPTGDFGDAYGMGLQALVGMGFSLMADQPSFQIVPKIEFHTFSADENFFTQNDPSITNFDGGSVNALMFGVDGRYGFGATETSTRPFILGGLGFASLSVSDITYSSGGTTFNAPGGDGTTELFFNFGAGVDIQAGDAMTLFLAARYLTILTEGSSSNLLPLTVGLRF